ncbi:hypothetical protein ACFLRP_02755 [Bacteroidota bacterium]
MKIVAALGISLLLLVGLVTPVLAFEMSLPKYINKLHGVEQGVVAVNTKLIRTLGSEIDTSNLPWLNAQVRILGTTTSKLDRLYDRVDALGPPPDDDRARNALTNVRKASQRIVDTVKAITPPDDSRVAKALSEVRLAAEEIVDLANHYLAPTTIGQ